LDDWSRPSVVDRRALLDLFRRLGCVQLDPIRHIERTHLLVLWSRLGAFDLAELEALRFTDRAVFEYWAHAASLVLTEEWPVYNWFMRRYAGRPDSAWFMEHEAVFRPMLAAIASQLAAGPKMSQEIEVAPGPTMEGRWWSGRYVGRLLDILWTRGEAMVYGRPGSNNHRLWGLADQFWPDWTPREQWTDAQVTGFAAQKGIRALGVATERQIKQHYTRGRYPGLTAVLRQLVKEEILIPATVEDLPGAYYLHREDLPLLNQIQAGDWRGRTSLLSPFDNLICDRERTEALFDFHYRIEIYTPAAKRQYGYYVLPILHGDRLIGRVDGAMDRRENCLRINQLYAEADAPGDEATAVAIRQAVNDLAGCLGATAVSWGVSVHPPP
jgi:uncharacterized protein